jgi:antitoxin component YwqK of YwqJK toxin-antitoxin module
MAGLFIVALSNVAPLAGADTALGRFLKDPIGHFIEARFQTLYHKRIATEQVVQSWQEGGQWHTQAVLPSRVLRFYDRGTETGTEEYGTNGRLSSKTSFSYDDEGQLKQAIKRDSRGRTLSELEYAYEDNMIQVVTYDENGNKVEQATYDKNMTLLAKEEFRYDSAQHLVASTREGSLDGVVITYSQDGLELSRTQLGANNETVRVTAFHYDKSGRLQQAETYDSKGELARRSVWTYEYDRHGFCVRVTEDITDASPGSHRQSRNVTLRNIDYVFTVGGLFDAAGEAFGMLIIALILLGLAITGVSWCIETLQERRSIKRRVR